jgi:hypothetical protein
MSPKKTNDEIGNNNDVGHHNSGYPQYCLVGGLRHPTLRIKMTDTSPFRFLKSIMDTKEHLDPDNYNPFFTNRGLSQHIDALMYAQEMNLNHSLPPSLQYEYLFHSIRKMRRPIKKWAKSKDQDDIDLIQTHFACNKQRAAEIAEILPKEQLKAIKDIRKV